MASVEINLLFDIGYQMFEVTLYNYYNKIILNFNTHITFNYKN